MQSYCIPVPTLSGLMRLFAFWRTENTDLTLFSVSSQCLRSAYPRGKMEHSTFRIIVSSHRLEHFHIQDLYKLRRVEIFSDKTWKFQKVHIRAPGCPFLLTAPKLHGRPPQSSHTGPAPAVPDSSFSVNPSYSVLPFLFLQHRLRNKNPAACILFTISVYHASTSYPFSVTKTIISHCADIESSSV